MYNNSHFVGLGRLFSSLHFIYKFYALSIERTKYFRTLRFKTSVSTLSWLAFFLPIIHRLGGGRPPPGISGDNAHTYKVVLHMFLDQLFEPGPME